MKIKRSDLNRLIENFINEEGTDAGEGFKKKDLEGEKTELGNTFFANQNQRYGGKQQTSPEKNAQAITDFRKGSDRGQFPPLTFGPGLDDEGNLMPGKFTTVHDYHEPDPYDQGAVRRYKKQHYLGPDEKGVDDPEITRIGLEDDEDTEESPYGTQYSMDPTQTQYRFDDKTAKDDGYTAHSDDDFYLGPEDEEGHTLHSDRDFDLDLEDEEGYEPSEEYTEEDTLYGVKDKNSKDNGIISRIRRFFSSK